MIEVLTYIVSVIMTYVMGIISKKMKWNEEMPIPIQNILVGIIVFVIVYFTQRPSDVEVAINQIMLALGGAGTATLCYDTTKVGKED